MYRILLKYLRYSYLIPFIILFGLLLRLVHLETRGIWIDEKCSLMASRGLNFKSVGNTVFTNQELNGLNKINNVVQSTFVNDNGNGVVYNVLLHFWWKFFNPSDFNGRLLSVIIGLFSIIINYFTLKLFIRNKLLFISGILLLCIQPLIIEVDQAMRMYSLVYLLASLALYLFLKIIFAEKQNNLISVTVYFFILILLFFTHYLTVIFIFLQALSLIYIIFKRGLSKSSCFLIAGYVLIAIICYLYSITAAKESFANMKLINVNIISLIQNYNYSAELFSVKNCFVFSGKLMVKLGGLNIKNIIFGSILISIILITIISVLKKRTLIANVILINYFGYFIIISIQSFFAGHTLPFLFRYAIFIYPVSLLIMLYGLQNLPMDNRGIGYKYIMVFFIILINILSIYSSYNDKSKGYREITERIYNPYKTTGGIISINYKATDTVFYPEIIDGIMTNIYLPEEKVFKQKIGSKDDNIYIKSGKYLSPVINMTLLRY